MNVESITPNDFTWSGLLPTAILIVGVLVVILTARAGHEKTAKGLALAFLAALVGSIISGLSTWHDTRAADTEIVISHFEQEYGLTLEEADLYYVNHADEKDVVRDVKASDGSLKHVLFRVVDGNVVPHLLDSASTWLPVQKVGGTE